MIRNAAFIIRRNLIEINSISKTTIKKKIESTENSILLFENLKSETLALLIPNYSLTPKGSLTYLFLL
jgi:hypothetical protein